MNIAQDDKSDICGWSLFSHVERPHAAMVMRDPIDLAIKGVRYQIAKSGDIQPSPKAHHFTFESWCYKARGAIKHQMFLSFILTDRLGTDPYIGRYVSDLKILNRHVTVSERNALSALKCASRIIDHINTNQSFDVGHLLSANGLIDHGTQIYNCGCPTEDRHPSGF